MAAASREKMEESSCERAVSWNVKVVSTKKKKVLPWYPLSRPLLRRRNSFEEEEKSPARSEDGEGEAGEVDVYHTGGQPGGDTDGIIVSKFHVRQMGIPIICRSLTTIAVPLFFRIYAHTNTQ